MKKSDFFYDLPESLIAQAPLANRDDSRLLVMDRAGGTLSDDLFANLLNHLHDDDLMVFNDTQVIKARLHGRKETGGRVEILIERVLGERTAQAQIRSNHSPRAGARISVGDAMIEVTGREDGFFSIESLNEPLTNVLDREGHMPLPPYIKRDDDQTDESRYQTVYASTPGAVAAPTAGLHFSRKLMTTLTARGIETATVTLHVGAGTFQPMRVDNVEEHQMHAELIDVDERVCEQINSARQSGRRVIAVGTTSLRSLETAWSGNHIEPYKGESRIFIYPGIPIHSIDGLITNFHLPESTLIMLVSAFAGTDQTLAAYRHAVDQQYRFFSYGDAMFIH